MDMRYLRYFVTVAEKMNFTRAAEQLGTSQPALSVQIRKLEDELGVPLFDREGRGVKLSVAGAVFLERARGALADMERSIALARLAAKGETGQLAIGYESSAEFRAFPTIVPAFRHRWPNVHLKFQTMKSFRTFEGIRNNELDLGFVFLPVPENEFDITTLTEIKMVVAMPTTHKLADQKKVSFADLSDEPMIMFTPSSDPDLFREINRHFTAANASLNMVLEVGNVLSGVNFVSMGMGCCILGDYVRRVAWKGVTYKTLDTKSFRKTLVVIKSKRAPRTVQAFYDFIGNYASQPEGSDHIVNPWDDQSAIVSLPN